MMRSAARTAGFSASRARYLAGARAKKQRGCIGPCIPLTSVVPLAPVRRWPGAAPAVAARVSLLFTAPSVAVAVPSRFRQPSVAVLSSWRGTYGSIIPAAGAYSAMLRGETTIRRGCGPDHRHSMLRLLPARSPPWFRKTLTVAPAPQSLRSPAAEGSNHEKDRPRSGGCDANRLRRGICSSRLPRPSPELGLSRRRTTAGRWLARRVASWLA
jgi:hypothetical protein